MTETELQFDILRYFKYEHLPEHLQEISKPFKELAYKVAKTYMIRGGTSIAETSAALRKLLEAKDCAVRAIV